jgi:hypothetical protein
MRPPPDNAEDLLAGLLLPWEAGSEVALDAAQLAELHACTEAVRDGRKVLLEIEAVFGATVLLLAESVPSRQFSWTIEADHFENHCAAVALYFMHYNFCRVRRCCA